MIICMIAAMAENRAIGIDNKLPWHYPDDLQRFKALTMDTVVMMGRNTYESIGEPLPYRRNIVISRTMKFPEVETYTTPELALDMLEEELDQEDELFIIGGASLYEYFLDKAQRLYLTQIKRTYEWDTFFPHFEDHFDEIDRENFSSEIDFVTYRRKRVE